MSTPQNPTEPKPHANEMDEAERLANEYWNENKNYHDSDGVDVAEVFKAGYRAGQASKEPEIEGLDDPPEFYDDAKKIQKPYGLKRHDEICDHLEQVQRMSEADVVTASVGIWMGIESERQHKNKKITALREENERLKGVIENQGWTGTHPAITQLIALEKKSLALVEALEKLNALESHVDVSDIDFFYWAKEVDEIVCPAIAAYRKDEEGKG